MEKVERDSGVQQIVRLMERRFAKEAKALYPKYPSIRRKLSDQCERSFWEMKYLKYGERWTQ